MLTPKTKPNPQQSGVSMVVRIALANSLQRNHVRTDQMMEGYHDQGEWMRMTYG